MVVERNQSKRLDTHIVRVLFPIDFSNCVVLRSQQKPKNMFFFVKTHTYDKVTKEVSIFSSFLATYGT